MDNNSSKSKLILWIFFSTSLITIFLVSSIISWILAIYWLTDIQQIWNIIDYLLYIISLWLTPYWIYLLSSNWNSNIESFNDKDIVYSWFWVRLVAYIIDYLLWYLIIPLFFNLYYWFKDWQTIWYKIFWIRVYRIDWDKLNFPTGIQLFFYPFLKLLNAFTLFIWFIMIWFTKRKQWLHNIINNTVVIKINK